MSKYLEIRKELDGNAGLYSAMTDADVVASMTAPGTPTPRESISGSELLGYTVAAEYTLLSDAQKQQWLGLCGVDTVTAAAVPLIKSLFNDASATWNAIVKTETKTRAETLGLGRLSDEDIRIARAQ